MFFVVAFFDFSRLKISLHKWHFLIKNVKEWHWQKEKGKSAETEGRKDGSQIAQTGRQKEDILEALKLSD